MVKFQSVHHYNTLYDGSDKDVEWILGDGRGPATEEARGGSNIGGGGGGGRHRPSGFISTTDRGFELPANILLKREQPSTDGG